MSSTAPGPALAQSKGEQVGAEWRREEGRVPVFVELRDVNYPGSTYNLRYVPDQDRLVRAYYQAVQRQTFDVEFVRQKGRERWPHPFEHRIGFDKRWAAPALFA